MIEPRESLPTQDRIPVRRALVSTYDKAGLEHFAAGLDALGIELISSGGTARHLRSLGLAVRDVSEVTGSPEILGGRVKTLHPKVHGGLLSRRGDAQDDADLATVGIEPIDMVVVNLYPFRQAIAQADVNDSIAAENIDIGGPAMVRAAAKNFAFVAAVTSPGDYARVLDELSSQDGSLSLATRRELAGKAFALTAGYDEAIAGYFAGERAAAAPANGLPDVFEAEFPLDSALRYGENPHQAAAFYGDLASTFEQLHGKPLSYNNLIDADAGLALITEFKDAAPTVAILKHTNPCGVATADSLEEAWANAFATDTASPFGGIVVLNRPCDLGTASAINKIFTEIVIAPAFDDDALALLRKKKNRRLLQANLVPTRSVEARALLSGFLCQESDAPMNGLLQTRARCVTSRAPTGAEWADLDFAWRVAKHVKSNAIVYAKGTRTLGVGAGQMSRIDASEIAVMKAGKSNLSLDGSVVASDAFFPFADGLVAAAEAGARACVQPGGSIRDDEVIEAANGFGVAMVFTGNRHFRH